MHLARTSTVAAGVLFGLVLLAALLVDNTWLDAPQREGPPALVADGATPRFWMLTKREEHRQIGSGRTSSIRWATRYHFDLQIHDAQTAHLVATRRLLTLDQKQGGHSARARVLGQDGSAVWIFLHDQPVALAASDGAPLAGRAEIEQRNPPLRTLLAAQQEFYVFDQALVVVAADARRWRLRLPALAAEPYQPPSADFFNRITFQATQWNGGWRTDDFLTRAARPGGGWLGIHTEREAADAAEDGFGDHLKDPDRILTESGVQRRRLWTARIGRTRQFSEGAHDRLADVRPVPAGPEFLQGGFVKEQGRATALALQDPPGLLVLHRTRADAQGRLALARLDARHQPLWQVALPFSELNNRWQLAGRLLLRGAQDLGPPGQSRWQEFLVALDLASGRAHGWNLTLGQAIAPDGGQGAWVGVATEGPRAAR